MVERKLGREQALGQATVGGGPARGLVEVDPRQSAKEYLDTLIHELLHILKPHWSEDHVATTANVLATKIWTAGYRRVMK